MRKFGTEQITILIALCLPTTASLSGQTPTQPAPTTVSASNPQSPAFTLKASAQRVLVDVIVKDKSGRPVHGLASSQFSIFENGKAQEIRGFDEHSGLTEAESAILPKMPQLPSGEFTNFVVTSPNAALNVILLDKLNTAQSDQLYVRQQLIAYLKHARPDARTAIFALTDHLILLQGFSSDPTVLMRALQDRDTTKASPLRNDTLGNNAGTEDMSELDNVLSRAGFDTTLASVQAFDAQYQSFQSQLRSQDTLDGLNQIGRAMAGIPGRKNLIWFTGNFPAGLFPGDNDPNVPYSQFAGLESEFRETVDLLTSNQVAIYPVAAQGLRTLTANNASRSNPQYGAIHGQQTRTGLTSANDIESESSGIGVEHLGMAQIAHDTGGEPFYNDSDLSKAVDQAISSGSNYYTLAYTPSAPEKKTLFRSISVKLTAEGYGLSYRRGYYTDAADEKVSPGTAAGSPALRRALMQGGPEPTEILVKVKASQESADNEMALSPGNFANPDANKIKPPFRTIQVDFGASMKAILIRHTADDHYHADVDFVTYVYDNNGVLVNSQSNTLRTNYTAPEMAVALRSGLPFTQRVSVPEKGVYILRAAVHDNIGDKVGAVEIPVLLVAHTPVPKLAPNAAGNSAGSPPPAR